MAYKSGIRVMMCNVCGWVRVVRWSVRSEFFCFYDLQGERSRLDSTGWNINKCKNRI